MGQLGSAVLPKTSIWYVDTLILISIVSVLELILHEKNIVIIIKWESKQESKNINTLLLILQTQFILIM